MQQKIRHVSPISAQSLESLLTEETEQGWHYQQSTQFFTSSHPNSNFLPSGNGANMITLTFDPTKRTTYRVEAVISHDPDEDRTMEAYCNDRITYMNKSGLYLLAYIPVIETAPCQMEKINMTERSFLIFGNQLQLEETSKIFKRAAEITPRINDKLFQNVLASYGTERESVDDHGVQNNILATFINDVLSKDDELLKARLGEAWEPEMAHHAVTAEEIAITLMPLYPFTNKQDLVETVLRRDEIATIENITDGASMGEK